MPQKKTIQRARKDKRQGKAASTQAGAFVREEIREIRAGKHGARSPEQAIAIGLSKARRAGVKLPPPARGKAKAGTRKSAARAYAEGQNKDRRSKRRRPKSVKRARAVTKALKREPTRTASKRALSAHAKRVAARKSPAERSAAAKKAARTREHRAH